MVSKIWHILCDPLANKQTKTQIGKLCTYRSCPVVLWTLICYVLVLLFCPPARWLWCRRRQRICGTPTTCCRWGTASEPPQSGKHTLLVCQVSTQVLCQLLSQHFGPWNTLTIGSTPPCPSGRCKPSPLLEVWAAPEFGQRWRCVWRLLTLTPKLANWELRAQI